MSISKSPTANCWPLVGPSGCGKSTLLRSSPGSTRADPGTVHIGGVLVEDGTRRADPEHRDVGLVFQEHALFPHLTVSDNLMFGLRDLPARPSANCGATTGCG